MDHHPAVFTATYLKDTSVTSGVTMNCNYVLGVMYRNYPARLLLVLSQTVYHH